MVKYTLEGAIVIPLLLEFFALRHGQLVTAAVFFVVGVAFHPVEADLVPFQQRKKLFPKISVQRRFLSALIHPRRCQV